MIRTGRHILFLLGAYLIYACTGIFTKLASQQEFLSWQYIVLVGGAVAVMGVYAILWQQLLKRIPLTTAYLFKGVTIIYAMLIAFCLFDESITWNNAIGSAIIIAGISLYNTEK